MISNVLSERCAVIGRPGNVDDSEWVSLLQHSGLSILFNFSLEHPSVTKIKFRLQFLEITNMAQQLGQVAFSESQVVVTPKTLLTETLLTQVSPDEIKIEVFGSSGDGVRNEHTITIADPVAASVPATAIYLVTTTVGAVAKTATFSFDTGMTVAQLDDALAEVIDLHPDISAAPGETAGTINVVGRLGGTAVTVVVDCIDTSNGSQVAGAISVAETVVESGTAKPFRKYVQVNLEMGSTTDYKPQMMISGGWYNGSTSTPTQSQAIGPIPTKAPRTYAEMEVMA